MYKPNELLYLDKQPKINDIDLKILQDFYDLYLKPFIFRYDFVHNGISKNIELHFEEENFCHLLGIESIAKNNVPFSELSNYRGENGWNYIYNGNLDFSKLKSINKSKFKSVKAKFVYFYLIPNLLEMPLAVEYKQEKVAAPTKIDCEILFFNQFNNAIIHLGIQSTNSEMYYVPRTFFIEKVSKETDDIYIRHQEKISVSKKDRIILLEENKS